MKRLKDFVESKAFELFIVIVIAINAIVLGIEVQISKSSDAFKVLDILDQIFLSIFVIEILLKMIVYRVRYFADPWRVFDFSVVGIALFPATGALSVLRSLRVLRALRMISVIPSLRKVVSGLLIAIPGLTAVGSILLLIFYVGAVIATRLFGGEFPEFFGNLGASAYTLFQIMTLESWSMGVVRPVMERFPWAWMFFVPFILVTTFTMLNLFIAVIVNAMQAETETAAAERAEQGHEERIQLFEEIAQIKESLKIIEQSQMTPHTDVSGVSNKKDVKTTPPSHGL